MTLLDLCKLLKKNLWLVVGLPVLCAAVCAIALTVMPAEYSAKATITVSTEVAGVNAFAADAAEQQSTDAITVTSSANTSTRVITLTAEGAPKDKVIQAVDRAANAAYLNAFDRYNVSGDELNITVSMTVSFAKTATYFFVVNECEFNRRKAFDLALSGVGAHIESLIGLDCPHSLVSGTALAVVTEHEITCGEVNLIFAGLCVFLRKSQSALCIDVGVNIYVVELYRLTVVNGESGATAADHDAVCAHEVHHDFFGQRCNLAGSRGVLYRNFIVAFTYDFKLVSNLCGVAAV